MKYIRCLSTIILLLLLLTNVSVEAMAASAGFSTEALPKSDVDTILKNANISMLSGEPQKRAIDCFAVNENEVIAIGCSTFKNKTVCIYNSDGKFRCGYSFECYGTFGIDLDEDILKIYFVRGDVAISIDSAGEIKSIQKIQNTDENNSYWNNSVFSTTKKVGDNEYALKNDMGIFNVFASSYSELTVTNANGEEKVIYGIDSMRTLNMVVIFVVAAVFICIISSVVAWQFVKLRRAQ